MYLLNFYARAFYKDNCKHVTSGLNSELSFSQNFTLPSLKQTFSYPVYHKMKEEKDRHVLLINL